MTHVTPSFTNVSFRYRFDDGSETGATWVYAADTDGDLNTETIYRMRALLRQTEDTAAANTSLQWEYNLNSTGWNSVTTTLAPVQAVSSKETSWTITDQDDTTQQLGSGTFITPNAGYSEVGTAGGTSLDFNAQNDETEVELCFIIPFNFVNDNDTLELRVTAVGETNVYTTTPAISSPWSEVSAL